MKFKWTATNEGKRGRIKLYAIRRARVGGKRVKVSLHRWIMGLSSLDPRVVHHKNDNGLDCRKENLEVLDSNLENMSRCARWRKRAPEPFL